VLWAATALMTGALALVTWRVANEGFPDAFYQPATGRSPEIRPVEADANGLALPRRIGSLRFAVMGDVGRGDRAQYDTANASTSALS
jgi:hypothetical protein